MPVKCPARYGVGGSAEANRLKPYGLAAVTAMVPVPQYNRRVGKSGDLGLYHETYRVKTSDIETGYTNMPLRRWTRRPWCCATG